MIGKCYTEYTARKTFGGPSEQTLKISELFEQGHLISYVLLKVVL